MRFCHSGKPKRHCLESYLECDYVRVSILNLASNTMEMQDQVHLWVLILKRYCFLICDI